MSESSSRASSPASNFSSASEASARHKINVLRDEGGFRLKKQVIDARGPSRAGATASGDGAKGSEGEKGAAELSIEDEVAQGAKYVISDGLRRVPPYYFTYLTYCKLRWRDRLLIDIFTSEFRDRDEAYYRRAIENGQVYINGKAATIDTVVRNGDLISHRTHKHEPPVTARPVRIVHEDDELVVIDKPGGMPVHPTGRYRFNTAVMVLQHEQGKVVHPCNRLDRLTSGLMFLAKTSKGADNFSKLLREREVRKEYVAKVVGEFPLGEVLCDKPLITTHPKVALNRVDPEGKEARTVFHRISFDGKYSIVRCRPLTGRTHQIRVHLQYLGYPIANDPIYSSPTIWGPELGKGGAGDSEEIAARLDRVGKDKAAETFVNHNGEGERLAGKKCEVCQTDLYTDPGPGDLDLWLHALKYSAADGSWSYETPMPEWALEPHYPFMRMALEEAKKSPADDSQFCVGAVLVKDGEVIETGYTRELPGNTHAEQCALEKYRQKHQQDVPLGTAVYTSMEPCSFRLSGNLPCADRIVEAKNVTSVFVGVVEPSTFVTENNGRAKLEQQGIEYIHVPGFEQESLAIAKQRHKDTS